MLEPVDVTFVAQPHADGRDLHDFLTAVAADPELDHLDVIVAWAKRSGLSRVRPQLEAVRARSGTTRLIVGIDEGGATRQGLALAREIFTSVHVFHDPSWRTFHPKVYLATGADRARLLVGSNNLTAGGVYFNYEAALECELALPEGDAVVADVRSFIDRLYADTDVCVELTDALYTELVSSAQYRIRDENTGAPGKVVVDDDVPEDVDSLPAVAERAVTPESVFGKSAEAKRPDPMPIAKKAAKRAAATKATPTGPGSPATKTAGTKATPVKGAVKGLAAGSAGAAVVVKRWFKRLSASDARHPPSASSHVTGVLRLVQAGHPISQTSYFREDFFVTLPWTATQRPRGLFEETTVSFRVVVDGADHGVRNVRIDHAPWREAGQGNHTTVLHWDTIAPILDAADHTGHFVVLECLSDGAFRLEITPTDPGSAAFMQ